ncbi:MAG: DUF370 domain-containing protein [Ruminococcaceae bacterium]|nr:DUF370 domain-containing protein [Oscillospiraceae bacterium]
MYLHIGNNKNVRNSEIIGIFDMDNSTVSAATKKFLKNAEKNKKMVSVCEDVPRSFIVTDDKVYISQLSSTALSGRIRSQEK